MFTITKNARIKRSVASTQFSTAEVASMKAEPGTDYYRWPFDVEIVGCGTTVPKDYDPKDRYRFIMETSYSVTAFQKDIKSLIEKHGLSTCVGGWNRGLDLALRDKAKPKPKAKMSDNDKVAFIVGAHGDVVASGKLKTIADYVKYFDEKLSG